MTDAPTCLACSPVQPETAPKLCSACTTDLAEIARTLKEFTDAFSFAIHRGAGENVWIM